MTSLVYQRINSDGNWSREKYCDLSLNYPTEMVSINDPIEIVDLPESHSRDITDMPNREYAIIASESHFSSIPFQSINSTLPQSQAPVRKMRRATSGTPKTAWTPSMVHVLVVTVLNQMRMDKRYDWGYRKEIWPVAIAAIQEECGKYVTDLQCNDKLDHLRRRWRELVYLRTLPGFSVDPINGVVDATDDKWDKFQGQKGLRWHKINKLDDLPILDEIFSQVIESGADTGLGHDDSDDETYDSFNTQSTSKRQRSLSSDTPISVPLPTSRKRKRPDDEKENPFFAIAKAIAAQTEAQLYLGDSVVQRAIKLLDSSYQARLTTSSFIRVVELLSDPLNVTVAEVFVSLSESYVRDRWFERKMGVRLKRIGIESNRRGDKSDSE